MKVDSAASTACGGDILVAQKDLCEPVVTRKVGTVPGPDFADLVDRCRRRWPVTMLVAPAAGRRVYDREDLAVLGALASD